MSGKKLLGAASAALMIVIVLTLVLAPAAGAAGKYKVLYAFHGSDGDYPEASLIFDPAGNLYGTTLFGGANNVGTIFKLTRNADGSWTESVLHSFAGSDSPSYAGLIFDASGNLYGTTPSGGANMLGTFFKLKPNADGSWTESVLHSFSGGSDGYLPEAGLIFDAAGNLYGTTSMGGPHRQCDGYGCGTVFKLKPNADGSWTKSVLHSFNISDGAAPYFGSLIFDAAGNLYGATNGGGTYGRGTVFKLTPNADGSWTESVLHSFKSSDGYSPIAGLIFDATGNIYGTTRGGGFHNLGTVFKMTPNADGSWTESVLHRFGGTSASHPDTGLIFDGAGNLYGTAANGGSAEGGAAFKLSPNQDGSWAYSLIHAFHGKPALGADGGLILDSAGTLYGTAAGCSRGCKGVVYQITP
jgi:uncharacterized repeat protein (TIGR03803 family)